MPRLMIFVLFLLACSRTFDSPVADHLRDARGCDAYASTSVGYSCLQKTADGGVRCSGYIAPGASAPQWQSLPISYPARSASHVNSLRLNVQQQKLINRALTKRNAATLRFVFLTSDDLIVFNAPDGPCLDAAGGYQVLNYTNANLFYEPGENPLHVYAGSTW